MINNSTLRYTPYFAYPIKKNTNNLTMRLISLTIFNHHIKVIKNKSVLLSIRK